MRSNNGRRKTVRRKTTVRRKKIHWAWWIGGVLLVVAYIWVFYYFFVSPFGFRWRALYGDADYPEGYEIRGIDISHYQGEVDWDLLQNAMIEKVPYAL